MRGATFMNLAAFSVGGAIGGDVIPGMTVGMLETTVEVDR